jgi:transposase
MPRVGRLRSGSPRIRPGTTRSCSRCSTRSPSPPPGPDPGPDRRCWSRTRPTPPSTRTGLRRRRIRTVIPERSDQAAHRAARGNRGGRPPVFDAETYKRRNVVERAFGRLKQWRGIATRYDKHARNYRAGIVLGAIVLFWLR